MTQRSCDDRFAERHPERSSRSVIREAVIGCAVFFPKIICINSPKCGIFAAQTRSI